MNAPWLAAVGSKVRLLKALGSRRFGIVSRPSKKSNPKAFRSDVRQITKKGRKRKKERERESKKKNNVNMVLAAQPAGEQTATKRPSCGQIDSINSAPPALKSNTGRCLSERGWGGGDGGVGWGQGQRG